MKHTLIDLSRAAKKAWLDGTNLVPQFSTSLAPNPTPLAPNPKFSKQMLSDKHGRNFPYLRLSITDVCNFSCDYCLPNGYKASGKQSFLTVSEIRNLIAAFAELGTHKIRITGGEPTLRKDFTEIVNMIAENKVITKLAFTTNGYKLKQNARKWYDAGLNAINVSIDTLNREKFHKLTGHDRLPEIMQGVDDAINIGFEKVKINAVLLKGINDDDLPEFLNWIKDRPISIRFIELMQTGDNLSYFKQYHLSADALHDTLMAQGWRIKPRAFDAGPATELEHDDYVGSIGYIAPYSKDFCLGCNRLRITSKGDLRLCLFGDQGVSLRHLLQHENQLPELKQLIQEQLTLKKSTHFLAMGDTGSTANLSTIGG